VVRVQMLWCYSFRLVFWLYKMISHVVIYKVT